MATDEAESEHYEPTSRWSPKEPGTRGDRTDSVAGISVLALGIGA